MKKGVIILSLVLVFCGTLPALAVTISAAIPGMTGTVTAGSSPGSFVNGFYTFALMIGGVLAFGAVVFGGILYAVSAGNPGKQSEGKEWIKSAIYGLLLLAGAYLVLYTINPNLVTLSLPSLSTIPAPQAPSTGSGTTNGQSGNGFGGGGGSAF
jgi:Type IV secretion system pilin